MSYEYKHKKTALNGVKNWLQINHSIYFNSSTKKFDRKVNSLMKEFLKSKNISYHKENSWWKIDKNAEKVSKFFKEFKEFVNDNLK